MPLQRREIAPEKTAEQLELCERIRLRLGPGERFAMVDTYGCQQNESDSEILRGFLRAMGYTMTGDEQLADVIVVNTCAVREHAQMRVFGNVGALTHVKREHPERIVVLCGCMAQSEQIREQVLRYYRMVDLCFGPNELWRFPELLERTMQVHGLPGNRGRVFEAGGEDAVAEGLPRMRDGSVKAWLTIMSGCNNFCSYCIVPYVRGRERSRRSADVIAEASALIAAGYRDITLLGQNVNSYGRGLDEDTDFPDLLRRIDAIPGDFRVRFMTSHPKDATEKLFRAMAECEKCAPHIHLPVQSGSNRILKAMNRQYTREKYLALTERARELIPDLVLTTDVIVGFPGETEEDFLDTLRLTEEVRFDSMFTFIYSPRPLFAAFGNAGGEAGGSDSQAGDTEPVRPSGGERQRRFRGASRLSGGPRRPGSYRRSRPERRLYAFLPHRRRTAGASEGQRIPDRELGRREDHRKQYLRAFRRDRPGLKVR